MRGHVTALYSHISHQVALLTYLPSRVNNRRESIQLQYTRPGHSRESNVTSTRADDVYRY